MHQYDIVDAFEQKIAEYAGSNYGVAVDSCTNAIKLSFAYRFMRRAKFDDIDTRYKDVLMPAYTYVGVPYAILAVGGRCRFMDVRWRGMYEFIGWDVIDSARRFRSDMFYGYEGTFYCLSFHETKHLSIGRGGMILTNDEESYHSLRQMRFDGRTPGVDAKHDSYTLPGFHCHMKPDDAARGLMLMAGMPEYSMDLPNSDYPDLSQFPIFQEGYKWMR